MALQAAVAQLRQRYPSYDASDASLPSLRRFTHIRQQTHCIFARKSKCFGSPASALPSGPVPSVAEQVRAAVPGLVDFTLRVKDAYPIYQLGWFPDYVDADNYLTPFFSKNSFVANHYDNPKVQKLISEQLVQPDKTKRAALIGQIQEAEAKDISTLPLLQGSQVAVVGSDVEGAEDTLDASFKFRYGALTKG